MLHFQRFIATPRNGTDCYLNEQNSCLFMIIGFKDAFYKYTWDEADVQGFKYDLTSIMHYENSAFTNGYCRPTMLVKNDYSYEVTPVYLRQFSPQDIQKINKLYNCQTTELPPTGKVFWLATTFVMFIV